MPKKIKDAIAEDQPFELLYSSMVITLNCKNHIEVDSISANFPPRVMVKSITRVTLEYETSDVLRDYYPAIVSVNIPVGINGNEVINNLPVGCRIMDITIISHIKQNDTILDIISNLGNKIPQFQ